MTNFHSARDRDAWATIRGFVYQVDVTIDRWLNLQAGQVLELEHGEDIDVVSEAIEAADHDIQRILDQVKHRVSSLTLRSSEAIEALVNFFEHRQTNPGTVLYFRFVTNAPCGHEQHSPFPNRLPAIEAWERLRQKQGDQETQSKLLDGIRSLLTSFQKEQKPQNIRDDTWEMFRLFVCSTSDEELKTFIRSFEWGMQFADTHSLRQSLQNRLQALQYARDADHAHTLYVQMFFMVFERLTHPISKRLTVEDRERVLAKTLLDARAHALLELLHGLLNTLEGRVGNVEERMTSVEAIQATHTEQLATLYLRLWPMMQALDGEYAIPFVENLALTRTLIKEEPLLFSGRRLIEDLFPLQAVSTEARREKNIRHGHIATFHLWWARRPIVAARALVYETLVSAPTNDEKRKTLKDFMEKLCRWDAPRNILEQARLDIQGANKGKPPRVLDIFTGGGSIPLEALRLGCETYAVDLNPVAHIIEVCTLDYPQRYGSSLVADVKRWGTWIIQRARKRLVSYYPPLTSSTSIIHGGKRGISFHEMSTEGDEALSPFAYLWTRTVLCSHCSATVPLVRQTWLRKKTGKYAALHIIPDDTAKSVRFEVVQARTIGELGFDPGTINPRHECVCLHCRTAIPLEYVKTQGQNGNIGQQLMAVVCTSATGSKWYLTGSDMSYGPDHNELVARVDALCDEYALSVPGEHVPQHLIGASRYGLTRFKDFFTLRQLVALLTWTIEVRYAYLAMLDEGMEPKRATAIATYLGVMINHLADRNSSLCRWDPGRETSRSTYAYGAVLPMVWDFTEINPFTEGYGSPTNTLNWMTSLIQELVHSGRSASIERASAQHLPFPDHFFDAIITDPPYYHAVPYADLSDFFYVWLKRSIGFLYPNELRTWLTPKEQEAIMTDNCRDQNENVPKQDYERMMTQAFVEAHRVLKPGAPLVCIHPDTSLPTLKHVLEHAGFDITYTWRLDAEKADDPITNRMGANPSVILVARQRERK